MQSLITANQALYNNPRDGTSNINTLAYLTAKGYPMNGINTLPDDYPMIGTNDYLNNAAFSNYPSMWRNRNLRGIDLYEKKALDAVLATMGIQARPDSILGPGTGTAGPTSLNPAPRPAPNPNPAARPSPAPSPNPAARPSPAPSPNPALNPTPIIPGGGYRYVPYTAPTPDTSRQVDTDPLFLQADAMLLGDGIDGTGLQVYIDNLDRRNKVLFVILPIPGYDINLIDPNIDSSIESVRYDLVVPQDFQTNRNNSANTVNVTIAGINKSFYISIGDDPDEQGYERIDNIPAGTAIFTLPTSIYTDKATIYDTGVNIILSGAISGGSLNLKGGQDIPDSIVPTNIITPESTEGTEGTEGTDSTVRSYSVYYDNSSRQYFVIINSNIYFLVISGANIRLYNPSTQATVTQTVTSIVTRNSSGVETTIPATVETVTNILRSATITPASDIPQSVAQSLPSTMAAITTITTNIIGAQPLGNTVTPTSLVVAPEGGYRYVPYTAPSEQNTIYNTTITLKGFGISEETSGVRVYLDNSARKKSLFIILPQIERDSSYDINVIDSTIDNSIDSVRYNLNVLEPFTDNRHNNTDSTVNTTIEGISGSGYILINGIAATSVGNLPLVDRDFATFTPPSSIYTNENKIYDTTIKVTLSNAIRGGGSKKKVKGGQETPENLYSVYYDNPSQQYFIFDNGIIYYLINVGNDVKLYDTSTSSSIQSIVTSLNIRDSATHELVRTNTEGRSKILMTELLDSIDVIETTDIPQEVVRRLPKTAYAIEMIRSSISSSGAEPLGASVTPRSLRRVSTSPAPNPNPAAPQPPSLNSNSSRNPSPAPNPNPEPNPNPAPAPNPNPAPSPNPNPAPPLAAPTNLTVSDNNQSSTITFTPPTGAIDTYEYSTDNGTSWSSTVVTDATDATGVAVANRKTITIDSITNGGTTLLNGTSYSVKISAVDSNNVRGSSGSTTIRPATTPDAPVVTYTPGNGKIDITVTKPTRDASGGKVDTLTPYDGGSDIRGYEYSKDGGTSWVDSGINAGQITATNTFSIRTLNNGTIYQCSIRTKNRIGTGSGTLSENVTPFTVPDAPTGLTCTDNFDGTIRITFTDLVDLATATPGQATNGGSVVIKYQYSTYQDNFKDLGDPSNAVYDSPYTIDKDSTNIPLVRGTKYNIKIRAVNGANNNGTVSASIPCTPTSVPDLPTNLSVIGGTTSGSGGSITTTFVNSVTATTPSIPIRFTPGNNGGLPITEYKYSTDGASTFVATPTLVLSGTSDRTFTITKQSTEGNQNLEFGTDYIICLDVINANGESLDEARISGTVRVIRVPDAPSSLSVVNMDGQAEIRFTPPDSRGSDIIGYKYSIKFSTGSSWGSWVSLGASVTVSPITIPSLTNGTTYDAKIRAVNSAGDGLESVIIRLAPVAPAPGLISFKGMISGDRALTLNFTPPTSPPGATFTYQYSTDSGNNWRDPESIRDQPNGNKLLKIGKESNTGTDLTNGKGYTIKIKITTGTLAPTIWTSSSGNIPRTVPAAPTSITGIGGSSQQIVVTFTPPNDGGSPIIEYYYRTSANGVSSWTAWVSCSPNPSGPSNKTFTVSGLTNGTLYNLCLVARNAASPSINAVTTGYGTMTSPVTPSTIPSVPTITSVTYTGTNITLIISAATTATNGGSSLTGFQYCTDSTATTPTYADITPPTPNTATSITITTVSTGTIPRTAITAGTTYNIKLKAKNSKGLSPTPSLSIAVTPRATPAAPSSVSGKPNDAKIVVQFKPPTHPTGGTFLYEYTTNGTNWRTFTNAPALIPASMLKTIPTSTYYTTISSTSLPTPTNFVNGADQTIQIRAVYPASGIVQKLPGTAASVGPITVCKIPDAPRTPNYSVGDKIIKVSFIKPTRDNSNKPITGIPYDGGVNVTYEYTKDGGKTWIDARAASGTGPILDFTITGLTNIALSDSTFYNVLIRAKNAAGSSSNTTIGTVIRPSVPPNQPSVTATAIAGKKFNLVITSRNSTFKYEYYLATSAIPLTSLSPWSTVPNPSTNIIIPATITSGTSITIYVRASNGFNYRARSLNDTSTITASLAGGGSHPTRKKREVFSKTRKHK